MNPFTSGYDPMNAFMNGYQLGDAMQSTAERARQQMINEKERAALSQMGQGGYLLGNEGNPAAVRPPWLSQMYQDNPHEAFEAEKLMGAPLADERKERLAAKLASDKFNEKMKAFAPLVQQAMGMAGGQGGPLPTISKGMPIPPQNAFASYGAPSSVGSDYEGMTVPGGGVLQNPRDAGSASALLAGNTMSSAPTMGVDLDISAEHGPTLKLRPMSEFERQSKMAHTAQEGEKVRLAQMETADKARVTAETSRRLADEQVYGIRKEIGAVKMAMAKGEIRPQDGMQQIKDLMQELNASLARRDSVYFGKDAPAQTIAELTPQEKANAAKVRSGKAPTPQASMQAEQDASIGAGLPYKQQVEAQHEKLKGDIGQTRKIIDTAQEAANSALQHKPASDRIMELLQKNDLGSRVLKLPGGTTAATIVSGNYDELNKWRNSLIDMDRKEGTSGEYNTIPELRIHSESLPAVDNDENTNRRAIVSVKNILEARLVAPQFLQQWADQHGGTLKGAREEFRSWMQNNPMYQTSEKNGAVSIHENPHYIPLDIWGRLRQRFSEKDLLKKRASGGIQVINGRVFYKE